MIQFWQALQKPASELSQFVQKNISNEQLLPLISEQQFLLRLQLKLSKLEHTQFFLKNIFSVIRPPYQDQLVVLNQFMHTTNNLNLRKIALELLNASHQPQININHIFKKLAADIRGKNNVQIQIAIKTSVQPQLQPLFTLLQFLSQKNQHRLWSNRQYRNQVTESIGPVFDLLLHNQQLQEGYLQVLCELFAESLQDDKSQVYFTLFLHNLLPAFKGQVIKILRNIKSIEQDLIFPNLLISRGVFKLFAKIFDTELYFDQEIELNIQQLSRLAQQFYQCISEQIECIELGWLAIFSLDKVLFLQQFEQKLHICASVLRQVQNGRADLVSEVYTLVVCNYIQKVLIKDSIQKLQSVLLMLTPSEFKYLIFKLSSILSEGKKLQIIQEGLKHPNTLLNVCLLYFMKQLESKLITPEISQFQHCFRGLYNELQSQILLDRYNTYQKELQHFIKWHMFKVSNQITDFKVDQRVKLSALLTFYKHLYQKDYFAEQFWINQEKMEVFLCLNESQVQKIETFCEFFEESSSPNLSKIMLLTALLKRCSKEWKFQLSHFCIKTLTIYGQKALSIIEQDIIPSNLIISLQYLLTLLKNGLISLKQDAKLSSRLSQLLNSSQWQKIQQISYYGRLNYNIQYLAVKLIEMTKENKKLQDYKQLLPCYRAFILNSGKSLPTNGYTQTMMAYYRQTKITLAGNLFYLREHDIKSQLKEVMCNYAQILSLKLAVKKSSQYFVFQSPIYKQQIVSFTYISQDPTDNYYFKNHYPTFIYQQYIKVFTRAIEMKQQRLLAHQLFQISLNLLQQILEGDTFSHSAAFYKSLIKGQNLCIILSNSILQLLDCQKLQKMIDKCLVIIEKDNYPLLRQYIEVVFCRTYLILNKLSPANKNRKMLLSIMKVNVNVGVPIALTLGYQLLYFSRLKPNQMGLADQISQIHEILVKFISCHTAYLRGICQYYLHVYLKLVPPSDPFLINIHKYWAEDKDSQKILTNIASVVQGFKEAVEKQCDFLGFQRVEEYPSNRVKLQFYRSVCRFYNESVLGEIAQNQGVDEEFYLAYCSSVQQRANQVKKHYLSFLQLYVQSPNQRCHKDNMKIKAKNEEVKEQKKQKIVKKTNVKKGRGKDKSKVNLVKQEKAKLRIEPNQTVTKLEHIFQVYSQIEQLIDWSRRNHDPKVIVIATLLQKVHNFGHILRTLNGQNAMVVVPSKLPLEHTECKELVPEKCDVQIVEIKQRDLQKFIVLMKKLGYPLVALQQCSRSVKVEQANFPQRFMLLLGNERLGAPAALLNEGDLLVEIPQVGKIRSLNVHVSMVICLWQFLTKQQSSIK